MKYRWSHLQPQPVLALSLSRELGISELLAQCLLNRGLTQPDSILQFLEPRLKNLADPFLLPNMRAAVDRLYAARERGECVVIFGDYDVDGVTATAILTEVFRQLGWQVNFYLPHRREEGYGLSQSGVENCLAKYPTHLLLAVDCGSTANDAIDWLQARGVDTIVLDHHQISSPPPKAIALVNPQCAANGTGHFTELCSAGLAFKLAHALVKQGRDLGLEEALTLDLRVFLDLVALGTIADLVPLQGENRILVTAGLDRLNNTRRPGLLALKHVAQINKKIGGYEVSFQLAPRLNAAGRLENALEALHLLLATDSGEANEIALRLDAQNRERQEIERTITREALTNLRAKFDPSKDFVIVEGQHPWHIGVVGIVASRVLQEFYRPTVIFGGDGEHWRGSGRSIEGFDLTSALRECTNWLVRHGGHKMAAGVSLLPANVDSFRAQLNEVARRLLTPDQLKPALRLDREVRASDLTVERVHELDKLQQTGVSNPQAQFFLRNVTHARPLQRIGAEKKHVKLWVTDGTATRECIWWGAGDLSLPTGYFDLAFMPQLNEYNGSTQVQLKVLDWRPTEGASPSLL
ncbi:MAG TPA: single-stranded-DNA-specific exonuclease RecJ [Candidatus Saccharimonadales bacterium]|nr:single-stranded-DNA-specific exonuclease RecJ [Candidatus Saccharimonadales bacterium]